MMAQDFEKRQQEMLAVFFQDTFKRNHMHIAYWVVATACVLFQLVIVAIPYPVWEEEGVLLPLCIGLSVGFFSSFLYLAPYMNCMEENGKVIPIYQKLKNLPISSKMLLRFWVKKLLVLYGKIYLIGQILQVLTSLIGYGRLSPGSLWIVALLCFIVPVAGVLPFLLTGRKGTRHN